MDIELFLRPVNLQLDIFLHDALLRIVTGPTYKYITKCRKTLSESNNPGTTSKKTQQHFTRLSPLHKLELRFTVIYHHNHHNYHNLQTLERRILFPILPWYIRASVELTISNHNSLTTNGNYLAIYTDGGGINGRIGASAVTMFDPWSGALPLVVLNAHA